MRGIMIDVNELEGALVYDVDGERIGRVYDLFVDDLTSRPEWLLVNSSGVNPDRIIPIVGMQEHEDGVSVPFARRVIDDAPRINWTYGLSEENERRLYDHFDVPFGTCSQGATACSDSILPTETGTVPSATQGRLGPEMTEEERSQNYRLVLMRQAVGRIPRGGDENATGRNVA
jgi:sporulation protein YlmC with PRC-barrel domain